MSVYTTYNDSTYKYGDSTRLYGLPTSSKEGFILGANTIIAQPKSGTPSILVSNSTYADFVFRTTCTIPNLGNNAGIVLRAQGANPSNYYLVLFSGGTTSCNLYLVQSGTRTLLDVYRNQQISTSNSFTVEAHCEGGWITILIDNKVVLTAYDTTYLSGNVGFYAEQVATFSNVQMPYLFESVASFTINSGDSFQNALQNLADLKGAYMRVDYTNSLNVSVPQTSDASVYSYYNEIFSDSFKQADEQDINYVIVFGSDPSISGVAVDTAAIQSHGQKVRAETITDETLTTVAQCQERATRELSIIQRYRNQPEIETTVNVGLEQYDVVTVRDDDANINGNFRVMNISTTYDANSMDYWQTLDLSNP